MAICLGRGGDQLTDEDLLHLAAGVDRQALPAADRFSHIFCVMTRFNLHQNRVDIRVDALRSDDGIE